MEQMTWICVAKNTSLMQPIEIFNVYVLFCLVLNSAWTTEDRDHCAQQRRADGFLREGKADVMPGDWLLFLLS